MFDHCDLLEDLNKHLPLKSKLASAHRVVTKKFCFIARIAITIYDPKTRVLKTYMHSSGEDKPLEHYQALLDDAPSLQLLHRLKTRSIGAISFQLHRWCLKTKIWISPILVHLETTGDNGVIDSIAAGDDKIAAPDYDIPLLSATIRDGGNRIADSLAVGDDEQIIAQGESSHINETFDFDTVVSTTKSVQHKEQGDDLTITTTISVTAEQ